jgi:hypothetical protein
MQKFISFSGGVESRTMAILYGKGATLLFSDTGSEHEALYESIDQFEKWIIAFHKGECKLLKVKHPTETLEQAIIRKKFMPSRQRRYCTYDHKIEIIDNFLKSQGECELMIGLNADEDRTGNLSSLSNVNYTYPLKNPQPFFEIGLNRDDCEYLLNLHGVHPSFPAYMSRGGCKFCFFKSVNEYKAMYHLNRQEFESVLALEKGIQDKRKKYFGIVEGGKSIAQIAKIAKSEQDFLFATDFKEIYNEGQKKHYCGLFCHR